MAAQCATESANHPQRLLRLAELELIDRPRRAETPGAVNWSHGVQHAMSDGILTREKEMIFRTFRDRMAALGHSQRRLGIHQPEPGPR